MYGDSITINLGGSGGTARVLNKINQDNYSAEYLDRISTDEVRMRVRHSKESAKGDALPLDRHNVVVTQTVFATSTDPEYVREFYFVFRASPSDTEADVIDVAEGLAEWTVNANLVKLLGWES